MRRDWALVAGMWPKKGRPPPVVGRHRPPVAREVAPPSTAHRQAPRQPRQPCGVACGACAPSFAAAALRLARGTGAVQGQAKKKLQSVQYTSMDIVTCLHPHLHLRLVPVPDSTSPSCHFRRILRPVIASCLSPPPLQAVTAASPDNRTLFFSFSFSFSSSSSLERAPAFPSYTR